MFLKRKPPESRQTQRGPLGYRGDAFLGTYTLLLLCYLPMCRNSQLGVIMLGLSA